MEVFIGTILFIAHAFEFIISRIAERDNTHAHVIWLKYTFRISKRHIRVLPNDRKIYFSGDSKCVEY